VDGVVARPDLRVDADCADDAGTCTVGLYLGVSNTPIASGTGGLHTTVSLAPYYNGRAQRVVVRATDSRGQSVEQIVTVFVETSPRWTEVATAPEGALWDFDAGRLLYATNAGQLAAFGQPPRTMQLRVRDRASGIETALGTVERLFDLTRQRGYLHPAGAIYNSHAGVSEWRGGAPVQLGGGGVLTVEGNWAVWERYRRDLAAGTTVELGTEAQGADPAPNGDVVYHTYLYDHEVVRYRGGTSQTLTASPDSLWNFLPVTDGTNVVFTRGNPPAGGLARHRVILIRPDGTEEELAGARAQQPQYAVENGWTAFDLFDVSARRQIWVRSPGGTVQQATDAANGASLVALGPSGELVYDSGGRRYVRVAPYTGTPVDVGAAWFEGWVRFRGGALYTVLGRSAFQISY
jgi:hypothetical protein